MSVGAGLSSGDLLWKFKLHFGAIFFLFWVTFENAEGHIQWKCKTNLSVAVKLRRSSALIKNYPVFFFGLGSVLPQTWLSSFCSWDQVVILKRLLLCLLQVLVMQWWSFCDFSVLLLYLPSADSGHGLVALDKEAWLTQSCVGVLCQIAYFIHSFGSSSLPAFQ